MYLINAMNVRDALLYGIKYLLEWGEVEQTRNGDAIVAPGPVTIHYKYPKQHVLVDRYRDANPFFHLMEAMWMLAGRQDGAFLDYYIKGFSKQFGDEYGIIPDAYGYRWRYGLNFNQLDEIITQLRHDSTTRQCVLQMWGAKTHDLLATGAKPCNLAATFRIVKGKLNMHVFNRSNDLVLGCCGANAVHFPIMQEYVASKAGIQMGEYWQVSTNLHMYVEHYKKLSARLGNGGRLEDYFEVESYGLTQPLMVFPNYFDADLSDTMIYISDLHAGREGYSGNISNPFLREVVIPMATAHQMYKLRDVDRAFEAIGQVTAADWKQAGTEWLERRARK
jgi:thymidylate synthase